MGQAKKVLLIEDDRFVHDLYHRALKKAGFVVISAFNGEEGLTLAQSQQIDLVLLDILLPKLNGIDVLNKLKADEQLRKIPIILLTNLGQESIIRKAFKIGAEGYLLKARLVPAEITQHVKEFFETGQMKSADMKNLGLA